MESLWERTEHAWKSGPAGIVVCSIAAICAVFLHWHLPLPGVAVAVLGAVAAIMSLRPDMKILEKAAWMLIVSALLYAEIRAIRQDRTNADRQALEDRQKQDESFKKIRDGQDADFKATAGDLKAAITGINSTLEASNRTIEQTRPHAAVRDAGFSILNEPAGRFQSGTDYTFNISFVNEGNQVSRIVKRLAQIYIAKADDLETQKGLVSKFEEEWKKPNTKTPMISAPGAPSFWSEDRTFSAAEMNDLKRTENTIYVLRRIEYSDSTGKWWTDRCEHFQKDSGVLYVRVTHNCYLFQQDRYRPQR
jgi:hypothetical protein